MEKQAFDINILTLAINDLIDNTQDIFKKLLRQENEHVHVVVNDLLEVWLMFTRRALWDSEQLAHAQMVYWQDYLLLCKALSEALTHNRTQASEPYRAVISNRQAILRIFIEKFSLLISMHIQVVIKFIFKEDDAEAEKKILFFSRQFAEAIAQHRFLKIQAEALYSRL